ncbi:hypothetical protein [Candidatus Uabimicrobium sp. HlEnr_7]|uniref:hypothetical protein n=1 Tax=Candidatus Uabimicrobium helgolandensis TaxID=3095367 RepID=UPI00355873CD
MNKMKYLLLVLLSILIPILTIAQLNNSIEERHQKALFTISEHYLDKSFAIENSLEKTGYTPLNRKIWDDFPILRKIEAAYISAEITNHGSGKYLLAILSKSLAQNYQNAITENLYLKEYLSIPIPSNTKLAYSNISKETIQQQRAKLPNSIKQAIIVLSQYSNGGAIGGVENILAHYFNLPIEKSYEILSSSNNSREALERGIKAVKPELRNNKISQLVRVVDASYTSARSHTELDFFRVREIDCLRAARAFHSVP